MKGREKEEKISGTLLSQRILRGPRVRKGEEGDENCRGNKRCVPLDPNVRMVTLSAVRCGTQV